MKTIRLVFAVLFTAVGIFAGPAFAADRVIYYHNDALGSPVVMTDSAGTVVWQADYEPFGKINQLIDNLQAYNTHQFIGKEFDPETSLHYLGARFYDGNIGRFLSVDPALLRGRPASTLLKSQLHNLYVYSANNPYRFVDKDGNSPIDIAFLVWDSGKLGYAIYTGTGVGEALVDAGLSLAGVVSPVPGTGQVLKAARTAEHAAEVARGTEKAGEIVNAEKAIKNPYGKTGKADHQEKVKELGEKAKSELQPGESIEFGKKIKGYDSNRQPDVQILDAGGKTRKIFEAERYPNRERNIKREKEYKRLGIPNETSPVK